MVSPPGWYPDSTNPLVSRYWDGSSWAAMHVWDGSAWVAPPGPPPLVRRRRHAWPWWVLGTAVVAVSVLVPVSVAGRHDPAVSKATFCSDLEAALPTLTAGRITVVVQGGTSVRLTAEQVSAARAGAAAANKLASESPDPPKHYLQGLARGESATADGRDDENPGDDVEVNVGQVIAWKALNCQ